MVQPGITASKILQTQRYLGPRTLCRHKSITAAIERGKQSSGEYQRPRTRRLVKDNSVNLLRTGSQVPKEPNPVRLSRFRPVARGIWKERTEQDLKTREQEGVAKSLESLPFTTAASEFQYGYSSVLAAIKANRRKFYKLYIHTRGIKNVGKDALVARARDLNINIQEVGDEYLQALDKASSGRPHNGFVLESSPLPVPPITELSSSSILGASFVVHLDKQSREDIKINGTQTEYSYKSAKWRHPLVLYVDGVLDEGNLGAIARSAYFLGVDAIVTPSRQSAPWSHVALKASAGGAEGIPIFKANQPSDFLGRSARNGWRIYASDAIPPAEQRPYSEPSSNGQSLADWASGVIYTYARSTRRLPAEYCPVDNHPTILMMGAEGAGLRSSLLNQAHFKVGIRHGREVDDVGVDSLNVSVAASLLCYEILQKPRPTRKSGDLLF